MADVARADQLKALRSEHRLTQPDMAEIAGVSLRAYQAWERENNPGGIKWEHAKKLAKRFGVDPEVLVRRRDEDPVVLDSQELRAQLDRIEAALEANTARLDQLMAALGLDDVDAGVNEAVDFFVRVLEARAEGDATEAAAG